jgi:WhiB family redox-sensing transcriptional regulator
VDWLEQAACKGKPTDWWVPRGDGTYPSLMYVDARAKKLCDGCPSRAACFWDGVKYEDKHMVRYGMTPHQRRRALAKGRTPRNPFAEC